MPYSFTPPPTTPQRGDRATFSGRVDAFLVWMVNLIGELGQFLANLTSLAAGGSFPIPYTFLPVDLSANDGYISFPDPTKQNTSNTIFINRVSASGKNVSSILNEYAASSSSLKGYLRITNQSDPSKFILFSILSVSVQDRYIGVNGQVVYSTDMNPFSNNDKIIVSFQRTGDKGDNGPILTPTLYVREEYAQGTSAPQLSPGSYTVRTLNAIKINSISGASLSANRVTLPAGTYKFMARAPAIGCNSHRIGIWNVTDNNLFELGSSEYSGNQSASTQTGNKSFVEVRNVVQSGTKTYEIRHYSQSANTASAGGTATNQTYNEVYAEFIIEKVA